MIIDNHAHACGNFFKGDEIIKNPGCKWCR